MAFRDDPPIVSSGTPAPVPVAPLNGVKELVCRYLAIGSIGGACEAGAVKAKFVGAVITENALSPMAWVEDIKVEQENIKVTVICRGGIIVSEPHIGGLSINQSPKKGSNPGCLCLRDEVVRGEVIVIANPPFKPPCIEGF